MSAYLKTPIGAVEVIRQMKAGAMLSEYQGFTTAVAALSTGPERRVKVPFDLMTRLIDLKWVDVKYRSGRSVIYDVRAEVSRE